MVFVIFNWYSAFSWCTININLLQNFVAFSVIFVVTRCQIKILHLDKKCSFMCHHYLQFTYFVNIIFQFIISHAAINLHTDNNVRFKTTTFLPLISWKKNRYHLMINLIKIWNKNSRCLAKKNIGFVAGIFYFCVDKFCVALILYVNATHRINIFSF